MSGRRDRRAMVQWEADTRRWAIDAARDLALAVYRGDSLQAQPFRIGVVLGSQESPWVQCPVRFDLDRVVYAPAGKVEARPYRLWLVTSERVVGRLGDHRLHGYRWDHVFGCRLDVDEGQEFLSLDLNGEPPLTWSGAGVAPMAVAAVYRLHGPRALVDHPGLTSLRVAPTTPVEGDVEHDVAGTPATAGRDDDSIGHAAALTGGHFFSDGRVRPSTKASPEGERTAGWPLLERSIRPIKPAVTPQLRMPSQT
jgi:hypothetical protein